MEGAKKNKKIKILVRAAWKERVPAVGHLRVGTQRLPR